MSMVMALTTAMARPMIEPKAFAMTMQAMFLGKGSGHGQSRAADSVWCAAGAWNADKHLSRCPFMHVVLVHVLL